ncbi:TIGR03617 family F420-dependent LLM class oxidoreductase [bacterium]|nr:TIGR03617 family F420-dependent LLM class oxidoreductase [bacterium]
MRIDAFYFGRPEDAAEAARAARKANLNGLWFPETGHDPFLSVLLASQAEPELQVGTGIAVGFARSPMTLAQTSWDLANLTKGKFLLGLGSQVKAHITRRFSMPWGKPVDQMRELFGAMRAIWSAFEGKSKLNFQGEYYNLNLLTPFFTPARHPYSNIPVGVAAVGPKMMELAGECADFLVYHSFNNLNYIEQVAQPALDAGLAKSGRSSQQLERMGSLFVITGDAETQKRMETTVRNSIAFYASTPAYKPVLDAVGFGDLHEKLHEMSRQGQWAEMAAYIPDEVLQLHSLRAPAKELPDAIRERFSKHYDRVCIQIDPADLVAMGL